MTNAAVCGKVHPGEEGQQYSWLEDYLERLEGEEAYRRFQDHRYDEDRDYYALVASLAA